MRCLLTRRGGNVPGIVGEVLRLSPKRSLNTVGQAGVAPVEDGGKEVVHQPDEIGRHTLLDQRCPVIFR
jgi:hypothetical protein